MLFAIGSFAASAQTVVFHETFDQCDGTGGNDGVWTGNIGTSTISADNDGWTFENSGAGSQCVKCGTSSKLGVATTPALNFEGNATMVIKAAAWSAGDATVLKISITNGTVSPSEITLTPTEFTEYTINITGATNGSQITFEGSTASKQRFWIDDVEISALGDEEVTAAPTFSPASGTYTEAQTVTISAEDGADIYYTTNGDDPTTSSTKYSAPFEVATTTTVKAIAVLDGVESSVASATYTFPTEVANIAAMVAASEGSLIKFTSPVTVAFHNGNYLFVTDGTDFTQFFGKLSTTYANGDVIPAGFMGERSEYQGIAQLAVWDYAETFAESTENDGEIAPKTVAVTDVTTDIANQYIRVSNVTVTSEVDGDRTNYYANSGSNKVMLYARFSTFTNDQLAALEAGKEYDVIGIAAVYGGEPQIYVVSVTEPGGSVVPDPEPEEGIFFSETFKDSDGGFEFQDIDLGTLNYVWKYEDGQYGTYWKASAFVGENKAAESWLVSPEIDLTEAKTAQLVFDAACRYIGATIDESLKIKVASDYTDDVQTANWTEFTTTGWTDGSSFKFVTLDAINLDEFAGKKIRLAFQYTSTTSCAPTFEINNIVISGTETSGVEYVINSEAAVAVGLDGRIAIMGEAADVEVYNMGGALIAKGNLNEVNCAAGAYIVKVDGKAQKVIVK